MTMKEDPLDRLMRRTIRETVYRLSLFEYKPTEEVENQIIQAVKESEDGYVHIHDEQGNGPF